MMGQTVGHAGLQRRKQDVDVWISLPRAVSSSPLAGSPQSRQRQCGLAVGRTMISLTSTSPGWPMA